MGRPMRYVVGRVAGPWSKWGGFDHEGGVLAGFVVTRGLI